MGYLMILIIVIFAVPVPNIKIIVAIPNGPPVINPIKTQITSVIIRHTE